MLKHEFSFFYQVYRAWCLAGLSRPWEEERGAVGSPKQPCALKQISVTSNYSQVVGWVPRKCSRKPLKLMMKWLWLYSLWLRNVFHHLLLRGDICSTGVYKATCLGRCLCSLVKATPSAEPWGWIWQEMPAGRAGGCLPAVNRVKHSTTLQSLPVSSTGAMSGPTGHVPSLFHITSTNKPAKQLVFP